MQCRKKTTLSIEKIIVFRFDVFAASFQSGTKTFL